MTRILNLLYHRVRPVQNDIYNLSVSPTHFEAQMQYLSENYHIIRFEEDWDKVDDRAITITFDDGYWDNYKYALPVLEKYRVPVTFFICTDNLGTNNELWWDRITTLLTMGNSYSDSFTLQDKDYHYTWETDTLFKRYELAKTMRWLLRADPSWNRRENWFEQLEKWSGIIRGNYTENRLLSMEELQLLSDSSYVSIGAHTCSHLSLGCLDAKEQTREIHDSIYRLENITKKKINVFSYPFGSKMDYDDNAIIACKENGIIKAATTNAGIWYHDTNKYEIPRCKVCDSDINEFACQIEDLWRKY